MALHHDGMAGLKKTLMAYLLIASLVQTPHCSENGERALSPIPQSSLPSPPLPSPPLPSSPLISPSLPYPPLPSPSLPSPSLPSLPLPSPSLPSPSLPSPSLTSPSLPSPSLPSPSLPPLPPPWPENRPPLPPRPTPPPEFTPLEDPDVYFSNGLRPPRPLPTILDELKMPNASLIEKILALEEWVCDSQCGSDFPSTSYRLWAWPACQTCQCDVTCAQYHTCCPDVVLRKQVTLGGTGSECVQLIPTEIQSSFEEIPTVGLFSSMITTCDAKNNTTKPKNIAFEEQEKESVQRLKCERPDITKPDEGLPVSDTRTELTYRNVHCALCNKISGDNILYKWRANVSCDDNADWLLNPMPSKLELFDMLTQNEYVERSRCRMVYEPKPKDYRRECRPVEGRIIKTCNESGDIDPRFYNADIERACHMYTSLFKNRYKNMFCYLCNKAFPMRLNELLEEVTKFGRNPARLSFSALIDFSSDVDDYSKGNSESIQGSATLANCSQTQFYDNASCSCRDILCGAWQTYDEEKATCRSEIQSQNLGYQACLEFTIELPSAPSFDAIRNLTNVFESIEPTYMIIVTISRWCPGDSAIVVHLDISQKADEEEYGRSFEEMFEDDTKMFCDHLHQHFHLDKLISCDFEVVDTCPSFHYFSVTCDHLEVTPLEQKKLVSKERTTDPFEEPQEISFLPYKRKEHCAIVEIPAVDFNELQDKLNQSVPSIRVAKSKVDFTRNNSHIRLCLKDYLHWTQNDISRCEERKDNDDDTSFDTWTAVGLISIITSCISLFFLFLTCLTYLLFAELRTRGWKNIMVLCVTLFIAHGLFEFAIEQFENEILCSMFGLLIHYFWLTSVFSMNACTIERFVKLCFPLDSRSLFMSKKPFIIATVHTFLCPFILVGCNVIANYVLNNRCGYGNSSICFINKKYSRIFSFIVPILAVVLLNTILMAVTIVKLRRRSHLVDNKKSSQSRIGLVACVRLSVVTGSAWLISVLYEVAPYPAMSYIFTLFLGLQGVIFFFSLLGNKRVFQIYVNLLKPKAASPNTASKSRTTTDTVDVSPKGKLPRNTNFDDVIVKTKNTGSFETDSTQVSSNSRV